MSRRVRDKYCIQPTIEQYSVGYEQGVPECKLIAALVGNCVETGLAHVLLV